MTSITLLEFSFAFVFLLLSISKDPSQTDMAPFVPGPRLPAIVRESHRCIRPTSNAPFKLDNSLWSIHLPILYSDYIKSLRICKPLTLWVSVYDFTLCLVESIDASDGNLLLSNQTPMTTALSPFPSMWACPLLSHTLPPSRVSDLINCPLCLF